MKMIETKKLAEALNKANIPFVYTEHLNGDQIIVTLPSGEVVDAIWNEISYGYHDQKLEIMGGLTEEEQLDDSVLGYLTGEEVAKRFIYCYTHDTKTYAEK